MKNGQASHLPQHVAIIMDGNRRWAKTHGRHVLQGHKIVVQDRIEELIEHAAELGIPYITFWAFSTENWERSANEVAGILKLFRWALARKAQRLIEKGARVRMIGDLSAFPADIQTGFEQLIEASAENDRITVTFALNYGGRDELLRAISKLLDENANVKTQMSKLTEVDFGKYLDTAGMPDPDLIIRTGGEQRLSGFLSWQAVYAELYFPTTYMPDFGQQALDEALDEYKNRERRYGRG